MINKMYKKTILITGGSSGLGKELAVQYSKLKYRIIICGRSEARLIQTSTICKQYTDEVYFKVIDVTSRQEMNDWIKSIGKSFSLDIVIANAGISAGTLNNGTETSEQIYQIFDINLYGVLNTILPSIEIMAKQNYGQIAIISSIAGLLPLPGAPSYSTTKGAIKILGDTLRTSLKQHNIMISVVIAGFIKTPLTDKNNFYMPFLMQVDKAANIIIKKLANKCPYICFPKILYYLAKFASILPYQLQDYLLAKLPAKSGLK